MAATVSKLLQRTRVAAGYAFAAIFIVFCRPNKELLAAAAIMAFFGLLVRGWACGHLRKVSELDTSGPYAFTRNPLYLGSFLIVVGFAIASGVWWLGLLSIIFFLGIYLPVINVEKNELEEVLGEEYRVYAAGVPIFVPRLTPWRRSERRFDFRLYLKHGEYFAAIGVGLTLAILALKAYLIGSL